MTVSVKNVSKMRRASNKVGHSASSASLGIQSMGPYVGERTNERATVPPSRPPTDNTHQSTHQTEFISWHSVVVFCAEQLIRQLHPARPRNTSIHQLNSP